ncbi:Conjugal transfer coupling protein TraG [Rhodovulum sp. P5]|nr:Conjugal transfer coupling protein TraG [Rhodovulum sp. P5]
MIVAPTRGGKAVSGAVPRLLDHPGSAVVLDVKGGELALITARYRQDVLGQNVVMIDPYDAVSSRLGVDPVRLNPVRSIDLDGDEAFDEAMLLSDAMTIGERGGEAFWTDEAATLIAGLSLFQVQTGGTLHDLRADLNRDREGFDALLEEMQASPYELVRSAAARMMNKAEKERSGVISTAQRNTHFLESAKLSASLSASDFNLQDLGRNTTLYIVLPVRRLHSARRWLRLLIALLIHAIANLPERPEPPVLFLLEEMAALERLGIVERSFGLMAGLGLQMLAVVQDFSQLRDLYGERWQTFIANAASVQCFGTNDSFTARYLSELSGQTTVERLTYESAEIRASLLGDPDYRGAGDAVHARPLIRPEELMALHPATQFIKLAAAHPVVAFRPAYFLDARYRNARGMPLFDIHPDHEHRALPAPVNFERAGARLGEMLDMYLRVG